MSQNVRYYDAKFSLRFWAFIFDCIICSLTHWLIVYIYMVVTTDRLFDPFVTSHLFAFKYPYQDRVLQFGVYFLLCVVVAFFNKGASLGKKIVNITVVDAEYNVPSLKRFLFRELFAKTFLSSITCLITALISFLRVGDGEASIHDNLAHTRVVDLKRYMTIDNENNENRIVDIRKLETTKKVEDNNESKPE